MAQDRKKVGVAPRGARGALFFTLVGLSLWAGGGCGGCDGRGGDARGLAPADADLVVVLPSLERFRVAALDYLVGIEGAQGLVSLVSERYGLDLSQPGGLNRAGVDAAGPGIVYVNEGRLVLAVGITNAERFDATVRGRLALFGGAVDAAQSRPYVARDLGVGGDLAWGMTPDHLGVLVWAPRGQDVAASWRKAIEKPARVASRVGQAPVAWATGRGVAPLDVPLPIVGSAIQAILAGVERWALDLTLRDRRLGLALSLPSRADASLLRRLFRPNPRPAPFAEVFPQTTTFFLRGRVDVAAVGGALGPLINLLPQQVFRFDRLPLPSLDMLLTQCTGEVAVAALGLDDEATVNDLLRRRWHPVILFQRAHVALALELKRPELSRQWLDDAKIRAERAGFRIAPLKGGGWDGLLLTRRRRTYAVMGRGAIMLYLTGASEAARFMSVGAKRALPLTALGQKDILSDALQGAEVTAGASLTFTRITRELAEKGMPPYFLKVLNSLRQIALRVKLNEKGLALDLEVSQ